MKQEPQTPAFDYLPDAREILMTLWRHRRIMVAVMLVTILLGGLAVMLKPRAYQATAIVMLEDNPLNLEDFADVTGGKKFDNMTVLTETKVIQSPALAMQTIKALKLAENAEFNPGGDDEKAVLNKFTQNLKVTSQNTARVIEISFRSSSPELAAQIANAHAEAYLAAQIEFKKQRVETLGRWFEEKVKDLKNDVTEKSLAVSRFRAQENLILGKDDQELIYQQISDISAQLAPLEVTRYTAQGKLQAAESLVADGQNVSFQEEFNSPAIQEMKTQASLLASTVGAMRAQYGPKHPKVRAAQRELAAVNEAISRETQAMRATLQNDEAAAGAQADLLRQRLNELQEQANTLREKMITLKSLQVEQEASQKLLDSFLVNYENIQSQVTFARPDAVIVSSAVPPAKPAPPGRALLLLGVIAFAGCLSLAVVFVIEVLRGGIRNFDDVRKYGQKPIGIMPETAAPAFAMTQPDSSFREAVKRVYMTGLLNHPARAILITSATPGEGRSTLVSSLAQYLMSIGHRVAVIDADYMRPDLTSFASPARGPGFTDVLSGRASLDEALCTGENGVTIVRAGHEALSSPETLRSAKFAELIAQLKQRFAYVLIDSGPLLAHSEAEIIAGQVEGIIVVAEWLKTSHRNMQNLAATLDQISTPVLGVVLNKVDIDKYKIVTPGSDFLLPKLSAAA